MWLPEMLSEDDEGYRLVDLGARAGLKLRPIPRGPPRPRSAPSGIDDYVKNGLLGPFNA